KPTSYINVCSYSLRAHEIVWLFVIILKGKHNWSISSCYSTHTFNQKDGPIHSNRSLSSTREYVVCYTNSMISWWPQSHLSCPLHLGILPLSLMDRYINFHSMHCMTVHNF